jgi:hypothetical protein
MPADAAHRSLSDQFDHLFRVIASKRFLTCQGLNNEVPFFIAPFDPADTVEMAQIIRNLILKLGQSGVRVLEVNLYDLCLELLAERKLLDRILDNESEWSRDQLKELLQGVLDPEQHLVPAIARRMTTADFAVLFLTGVGEIYPYIRSHTVLNNLQSTAKDKPTVMFFPGTYTHSLEQGASLDLFGQLHDDKYYRAYNLNTYEA